MRQGNQFDEVLGWPSAVTGLAMLTRAERLCRPLQLEQHTSLVRLLGARDVLIGLGLFRGGRQGAWRWARTAADAFDAFLLAATLRRGDRAQGRRAALAAGAVALTLLDAAAAIRSTRRRPAPAPTVEDTGGAPTERRIAWLPKLCPWEGEGTPSADTLERVMGMLDAELFAECFIAWMRDIAARRASAADSGEVRQVAVDGG
jgi:hypothetical protein